MTFFWLKKFVSFWLMPVPFCLTLLAIGWWLTRGGRRSRAGRGFVTAALLLLVLFSNKVVSNWLVRPLETRYPPIPELAAGQPLPAGLAACRYVVVLGGGHGDAAGRAAVDKLSPSSVARLVEGVRLARALPSAGLIVSGPAVHGNPSHASVLAQAAAGFGIDPSRIQRIDTALDTEDESHAVRALVGDAPVALVTSAAHMPRAAALFQAAGIRALPCPVDFTGDYNPDFRWNGLNWDSDSLGRSTWAVRERLGALWLRLRGKIE
jgi:uncharacterized SAM-binding protein YcdF (DUF218 family)